MSEMKERAYPRFTSGGMLAPACLHPTRPPGLLVSLCAATFLALPGCASDGVAAPEVPDRLDASPGTGGAVAFVGVHVVPMDREIVLRDHTVVVEDGRIGEVGPRDAIDVPPSAAVIEGDGRYLLPGLADMHVHLARDDLDAYLAHGITTVRNMWGFPAIQVMQAEIEAGSLRGPAIHSVSPGLDGSPPRWPFTQIVDDPATADSVVQAQGDAGWTTLKLYQDLSRATYDSVVAAATRRGLEYVGHTPTDVGLGRVLEAGQRSVEHLGGYVAEVGGTGATVVGRWASADPGRMAAVAELTALSGAWVCPTLAIQLRLQASAGADLLERAAENRRRMVRTLHEAGARLLVGTDAGIDVVAPGNSMVTELREFVRAGLSPYEALSIATTGAARYLGEEGRIGVIRKGARADLVLVETDPLAEVTTLGDPAGTMVNGTWYARSTLEGPDR